MIRLTLTKRPTSPMRLVREAVLVFLECSYILEPVGLVGSLPYGGDLIFPVAVRFCPTACMLRRISV